MDEPVKLLHQNMAGDDPSLVLDVTLVERLLLSSRVPMNDLPKEELGGQIP
jgi:hypothetical protein